MKPADDRVEHRRAMLALIATALLLAGILGLVLDRVLAIAA